MLDILLFREDKGGNPDLIRESQRRRHDSVELVDEVIELDRVWRATRGELDDANAKINTIGQEIKKVMRETKDKNAIKPQLEEKKNVEQQVVDLKEKIKQQEEELNKKLHLVGNLIHESVPISETEDDNQVVRVWGEKTPLGNGKNHHELLWMIDGYEPERGVAIAGSRQYFLKGWGVRLQMALVNYGMNFLAQNSYTPLTVPLMMKQSIMAETAELAQFDEELYKVTGDGEEEKYLIATSEQPISAYHRNEWMDPSALPLKYCGLSTCFRKEAGSSGRETWGIFRVHQFEKVEQFVITDPESSWQAHEEMTALSEKFLQSLGLPYHVISIVSGALNKAAAKKYDIEAWFPGYDQYKEVVSCSNCTDYQARRMKIRFGESKKQGQTVQPYVHMLNGTLCATTRTICAILENYQTEDGINIPPVLLPYMHLPEGTKIPFTRPAPSTKAPKSKGKKIKRQTTSRRFSGEEVMPGEAVVYSSTTGGNFIQKNTERMISLVKALRGADPRVVYLDIDGDDKEMVWSKGPKGTYPLLFVGGEFLGTMEEVEGLNEEGRLRDMVQDA